MPWEPRANGVTITSAMLDRQLTILEQRGAPSASTGEVVHAWVPLRAVRCRYMPVNGREGFSADSRFSEVDARFTIRFDPSLRPTHRIEFEGVVYRIIEVQELPRRAWSVVFVSGRAE